MKEGKKPRKDKRSERTKQLISDTLQALLHKMPFSSITVNDICIEAEVSRATFYLYFEDKYQLLYFTTERWGDSIQQMAEPEDFRSLVDAMLETLYAHKKVIHNILLADNNEEVHHMFYTNFVRVMTRAFEKQQSAGFVMDVPIKALSIFCAAGVTYMIISWLEGDIQAPRDEMCAYLMKIAEGKAIVAPALE